MGSAIVYMTKRQIMHKDQKRLKKEFKNRPTIEHVGPWVSMEAKNHSRLVPPVLCTEFFLFPYRRMNFERFHKMLDVAIQKLGRFKFDFTINTYLSE